MRCQSPLSSEALMSCVGLTLSFTQAVHVLQSLTSPCSSPVYPSPSPPNSPNSVFSIHVPEKQAAIDIYVSVMYNVPLPLEILLHYFSSPSTISLGSSAGTRLPLPSTFKSTRLKTFRVGLLCFMFSAVHTDKLRAGGTYIGGTFIGGMSREKRSEGVSLGKCLSADELHCQGSQLS